MEAVIVLPLFIALLFGLIFVSRSISQRHQAQDLARSCAWRYSANGCSYVPDGCEELVERVRHNYDFSSAVTSAGRRIDADFETIYVTASEGIEGLAAGIVGAAFGDVVTQAMQKDAKGTVPYNVSRKGLGGGLKELTVSYQLPCNLKKQTVKQVVLDAWEDLIRSRF